VRYHDATNYHTLKSIEDGNGGLQVTTYLNGHICLTPGGTGKVGIGTTIPVRPLDVTGTAKMDGFWLTSSPADGHVLTSDATGVGTWQAPAALPDGDWTISGDDMYATPEGNVGIGTTSPESRLHVKSEPDAHWSRSIIGRVTPVTGDLQQVYGVMGETMNSNTYANSGAGVYGRAAHINGGSQGVRGDAIGATGRGVFGWATHTTGVNYGVYGATDSPNGFAGYFRDGKSFFTGPVGIGTESPDAALEIYEDTDAFVGINITNPNTGISSSEGIYFNNEDGSVAGIRLHNSDQMTVFNNRPVGYISFNTGGLQRMVLSSGGRVGIATSSPNHELHVNGTIQIGSAETLADSGAYLIACRANFAPDSDGARTLGISSKRWASVWAVDGTINTSDLRLKQDISDIPYGLEEILGLRPIAFRWRDHPEAGTRLGLVAQEVEPLLGEVVARTETVRAEGEQGVTTRPAENLGIYYSQLVPVLIKAMQEQQGIIEEQDVRIEQLEARLSQLEHK
jgi:hypothetical protein